MNPDRSALVRLVGMLIVFSCWAALIALACSGCRPLPEPQTPIGPAPDGPPPADSDAGPTATPCGRAADRYLELRCGGLTREKFAAVCEGYGKQPGSSAYNPECMARAADCGALSRCRGGE